MEARQDGVRVGGSEGGQRQRGRRCQDGSTRPEGRPRLYHGSGSQHLQSGRQCKTHLSRWKGGAAARTAFFVPTKAVYFWLSSSLRSSLVSLRTMSSLFPPNGTGRLKAPLSLLGRCVTIKISFPQSRGAAAEQQRQRLRIGYSYRRPVCRALFCHAYEYLYLPLYPYPPCRQRCQAGKARQKNKQEACWQRVSPAPRAIAHLRSGVATRSREALRTPDLLPGAGAPSQACGSSCRWRPARRQ